MYLRAFRSSHKRSYHRHSRGLSSTAAATDSVMASTSRRRPCNSGLSSLSLLPSALLATAATTTTAITVAKKSVAERGSRGGGGCSPHGRGTTTLSAVAILARVACSDSDLGCSRTWP